MIRYENLTLTELDDGTLAVTFCDKDAVRVTVPDKIDGKTVSAIGEEAFKDCKCLISVTLPERDLFDFDSAGLTEIGEYAFSGCVSLTEIEIPESVSGIGRGAFHSCRSLIKATLPVPIYLAPYTFAECVALRSLSPIGTVSEGLFSGCSSLERITLSEFCREIDEDAFEHCVSLCDVTLPKSVKRVGALAFRGCQKLHKVTFLESGGWYASNRYRAEDVAIDVSDPVSNAKRLATADFDDGTVAWYRH